MPERFVLVLAGGRGERFWPWSRPERPKQLLPLLGGGRTLLAATLARALRIAPAERILVLTAEDLVPAVRRECPGGVHVLGEPRARNTAPAIGVAAILFHAVAPDASFAVFPADHAIEQQDAFAADLDRAFVAAERDPILVTFGITPTGPDSNFGYIRRGATAGDRLYRVARFTEKPDRPTAEGYLASGEYFWNSGIFVWGAASLLGAMEASRPQIAASVRTVAEPGSVKGAGLAALLEEPGLVRRFEASFEDVEAISVDYAVLESAPNVVMIQASFDWDDLGSWGSWARRQPRDGRGNVLHGDALAVDCDDCVVVGEGGLAAATGLSRMVVVHVDGATLACPLDQTEQVRKVTEAVRARERAR